MTDDWEEFIDSVKPLEKNKYSDKNDGLQNSLEVSEKLENPSGVTEFKSLENLEISENSGINLFSSRFSDNSLKLGVFLQPNDFSRIDGSHAKSLKKGTIKIDDRLDLHGFNLNQAEEEFYELINHSFDSGFRCVLVISGKGLRSGGNISVLKEIIPYWVNSKSLCDKIIAYSYAARKHGGDGAYYILLKKNTNL